MLFGIGASTNPFAVREAIAVGVLIMLNFYIKLMKFMPS
jgi:hypothetical protein